MKIQTYLHAVNIVKDKYPDMYKQLERKYYNYLPDGTCLPEKKALKKWLKADQKMAKQVCLSAIKIRVSTGFSI